MEATEVGVVNTVRHCITILAITAVSPPSGIFN